MWDPSFVDCLSLHLSDLSLCLDLGQGANQVLGNSQHLHQETHISCLTTGDIKIGDLVKVVKVPFPFLNEKVV